MLGDDQYLIANGSMFLLYCLWKAGKPIVGATMKIVEIVETSQGQTVQLPDEFRFAVRSVTIRRAGNAVILEPLRPAEWPEGFFDSIYIDDPAFVRPDQGPMPPAPAFE